MPTDPHHTPIITQPSSSQPQRKQKSRRLKRKDTEAPQPSDPTNVADEAVNEEPSMQLKELIDFCTKLQQRVLDLENTKTAQAQEITSLKLRVKKLEKKGGSRTHKLKRLYKVGRSARVVSSEEASLGDQEDTSKQGRKIDDIDKDAEITLVDAIPLATKPPSIVDYKIIKEGKISYYQIIRADGSSKRYSAFIQMLRSFDREDLETLWKLVKAKHGAFKRVNTFVDFRTDLVEGSSKRAGEELEHENVKKQKVDDDKK
ncbi:hypothetical protein Tco_0595327 [Tanacetum coccineum]